MVVSNSHADQSGHAANTRMQCMQVWGGSGMAETTVSTTGLDVWLYSRPYGEHSHGGDVYYLSSCSSGRITRLVLADVRGHGEQVVGLASSLRRLMQRHIDHISQRTLVESINREFVAVGDHSTFATGLLFTYFVPTATLSITNAGHPAPLVFRSTEKRWRTVEPEPRPGEVADVPLGIFEEAVYGQRSVKLTVNDRVLCYTDALVECVDERGEMLGLGGLARVVRHLGPLPPSRLIPALVERLKAVEPSNLSGDDVTIILVHPNGATVSLRDNLLAPFRYLSNLRNAWA